MGAVNTSVLHARRVFDDGLTCRYRSAARRGAWHSCPETRSDVLVDDREVRSQGRRCGQQRRPVSRLGAAPAGSRRRYGTTHPPGERSQRIAAPRRANPQLRCRLVARPPSASLNCWLGRRGRASEGRNYPARLAGRRPVKPSAATVSCGYRQNMPSTSFGSSRRIRPHR